MSVLCVRNLTTFIGATEIRMSVDHEGSSIDRQLLTVLEYCAPVGFLLVSVVIQRGTGR
jgi:hypothetical protein